MCSVYYLGSAARPPLRTSLDFLSPFLASASARYFLEGGLDLGGLESWEEEVRVLERGFHGGKRVLFFSS